MNIAIAGGTGLVGSALTDYLIEKGHHIYILTRNSTKKKEKPSVTYVEWMTNGAAPEKHLHDVDAFVNLAGESINSRWTNKQKGIILESRISVTKEIIRIIDSLEKKPEVLINASAIGFYGNSLERTFTEEDKTPGTGFLASTVNSWEKEAQKAAAAGVRTVYTRFGIVLDKSKGALPKMLLPYYLFAGGKIGSGKQWMSWVHIQDVAGAIAFCFENKAMDGPVNVTAPFPLRMDEFGRTAAKILGRPYWFPTPGFALKIAFGEMSELVLEGQKVLPRKLEEYGYKFNYSHLDDALSNILQSK